MPYGHDEQGYDIAYHSPAGIPGTTPGGTVPPPPMKSPFYLDPRARRYATSAGGAPVSVPPGTTTQTGAAPTQPASSQQMAMYGGRLVPQDAGMAMSRLAGAYKEGADPSKLGGMLSEAERNAIAAYAGQQTGQDYNATGGPDYPASYNTGKRYDTEMAARTGTDAQRPGETFQQYQARATADLRAYTDRSKASFGPSGYVSPWASLTVGQGGSAKINPKVAGKPGVLGAPAARPAPQPGMPAIDPGRAQYERMLDTASRTGNAPTAQSGFFSLANMYGPGGTGAPKIQPQPIKNLPKFNQSMAASANRYPSSNYNPASQMKRKVPGIADYPVA